MLKVILSVLLLALVTTLVGYQQLQATITSPLNITTPTQFEVKKGMGFNPVSYTHLTLPTTPYV